MYNVIGKINKGMLNFLILEILKDHSDENHVLTHQDIINKLKSEYDVDCERHAVRNNILGLQDLNYDIITTNKGSYLAEGVFDDAEIVTLIDGVLFSKSLSHMQKKRLIEKLKDLGNKYFRPKVTHTANLSKLQNSENTQTMNVVNVISKAVAKKRKIKFTYNRYGTDFKLHPRRSEKYIVNPYQLVLTNGRYYLIGNYDKYDDISHYKVDRITDIEMLKEPVKPKDKVKDFARVSFNLPKHMAEHIYMYSGESTRIEFIANVEIMDELVDWFGKDFSIQKLGDDKIRVILNCNEQAMVYWALQYGSCIVIESPQSLIDSVKKIAQKIVADYD